jgi:hypothetical protein
MRLRKLSLLIFLSLFLLSACDLPSIISDLVNEQATAIALPQKKVTPNLIYFENIHTDVVSSGDLVVIRSATIENLRSNVTYALLENKNSDPTVWIDRFNYRLTWLDDQNRVIVESSGEYRGLIPPGEKMLVNLSMSPTGENKNRKISRARFEITGVGLAQIDEVYKNKIRLLKLPLPLISVDSDPYELEEKDFFDSKYIVAAVRLTLHNNLNSKIKADVVALFLNARQEVVGVGISSGLSLTPRGSKIIMLTSSAMSGPASNVEYYASVYSYSAWTEVYNGLLP